MDDEKSTVRIGEEKELETTEKGEERAAEAGKTGEDESQRLYELEKQLKDERDRLLRTAADLDNTRKRAKRDVEDAVVRGRQEVLREILPVIDSVDLALSSGDPEGPAKPILDGVEMVRRQFLNATERFGLKPIESVGQAFDPNVHEAVSQIPSQEHPAGQIVQEMRRGYLLGERLLRAAMVIVSRGPQGAEGGASGEPKEPVTEESSATEGADRFEGDKTTDRGDSSAVEEPHE